MLLTALAPGSTTRITGVRAGADASLRLREMGMRAGTTLRLDMVAAGGARIVAVGGARLAIDHSTAALIDVAMP